MTPPPTTVVTGAAGYLGRALARALAGAGHRPVLVDRAFAPDAPGPDRTARRVAGDARDLPDLVARAVGRERIDHVVHAAAVTASPEADPASVASYLEEHARAAFAALNLAVRHEANAVLISSAAVFAQGQGGDLHEGVEPCGSGPYATAKRAAELVWAEAAAAGARATTVRLGNLYGGNERASASRPRVSLAQEFVDGALGAGRIAVARPDALRDWTYLPDVAVRIAALLDGPRELPVRIHLVAPGSCSDLRLAQLVAERVPGTRVVAVDRPAGAPLRGVLTSGCDRLADGWTTLEAGLDALTRTALRDGAPA